MFVTLFSIAEVNKNKNKTKKEKEKLFLLFFYYSFLHFLMLHKIWWKKKKKKYVLLYICIWNCNIKPEIKSMNFWLFPTHCSAVKHCYCCYRVYGLLFTSPLIFILLFKCCKTNTIFFFILACQLANERA